MDRRRFLLLAGASPLLLIACGGGSDDKPAASNTSSGAAEPKHDGTARDLVAGWTADLTNVADTERTNLGMNTPNANIYETLTRMDENLQVQPGLAERWEYNEAANTYKFFLRKGVKFHDGTELTAQDVVFSWDRIAKVRGEAYLFAGRPNFSTKALDQYTVEYTPVRKNPKVVGQVVHPAVFGIMKAGSDPLKAPVGTGPFKFVSYAPKESLKVARFDDYWDKPNAAKVSSITFKFIPDQNARVLALQAGDVDMIQEVPRESAIQLKGNNKFRIVNSPVGRYEAISINVNGEGDFATTRDAKVREAVAKGIDRETIVKQVWEGNAELAKGFNPPSTLGKYQANLKGVSYDPEGAKKILDDAGWKAGSDGIRSKDGKRLELLVINGFPSAEVHRPIPEVIQSQLKKIGVEVKIQETTSYDDTLKAGKGHLWIESGNYNLVDPNFFVALLYRSEAGGNTSSDYGKWFGIGGKVDTLAVQAATEADMDKVQQLVTEAWQELIEKQFVVIPIAGLYNIWATNTKVSGFKPHPAFVHQGFASIGKNA